MGYGARGYVCKFRSETELEAALLSVLAGEIFIDPAVKPKIQTPDETRKLLTARETEILALVKSGLSNQRFPISASPRTWG